MKRTDGIGITAGCFLLPGEDCDLRAWAVIACDQHTSEPEYWRRADEIANGNPSTLRLILPEAFLKDADTLSPAVNGAMRMYLRDGVLSRTVNGMVLVARATETGTRLGLVACVDLEQYDFTPGIRQIVRPTESTVSERIPPRLAIRQGAALELSHVLMLLDDPMKTVIEPLYARRGELRPLYDFDLMLGGGHVSGWAVEKEEDLEGIYAAMLALKADLPEDGMLLAVGDGNHSLATARTHWLKIRDYVPEHRRETHPARYAMAEIGNLHSEALRFEPIHRIVFHKTAGEILQILKEAEPEHTAGEADAVIVTPEGDQPLRFRKPLHLLPVGTVQALLDKSGAEIDYIHGESTVRSLARDGKAVGILLPALDKHRLFPAVSQNGVLPRKTFSMGEACEKRYYIESRRIIP